MTLGLLAPGSPKLSYQDKEEEIEDMLMLCIMSYVGLISQGAQSCNVSYFADQKTKKYTLCLLISIVCRACKLSSIILNHLFDEGSF
jgi:hypothetical protein